MNREVINFEGTYMLVVTNGDKKKYLYMFPAGDTPIEVAQDRAEKMWNKYWKKDMESQWTG